MSKSPLSSRISLLCVLLLAFAAGAYLLLGVAKWNPLHRVIHVTVSLPDAANLVPRSPVTLSGVRIGEVTQVRADSGAVLVNLTLNSGSNVPKASSVAVESLSALSEPYLDFHADRLTGPYFQDGQRLQAERVSTAKSVAEVAESVTKLMKELNPKAFSSLVRTSSQALTGTDRLVPRISRATDLLAATLLAEMPQLRSLLQSAQVPATELADAGAKMSSAGPEWIKFGVKVQGVVESLGDLLHARPLESYRHGNGLLPYLGRISAFINRIGPDLKKLFPVIGPLITTAGQSVSGVNLSTLITQALDATNPDGTLRFTLDVTNKGQR